jgi:hypothetical protein
VCVYSRKAVHHQQTKMIQAKASYLQFIDLSSPLPRIHLCSIYLIYLGNTPT